LDGEELAKTIKKEVGNDSFGEQLMGRHWADSRKKL
jgi:hypothetical protein